MAMKEWVDGAARWRDSDWLPPFIAPAARPNL